MVMVEITVGESRKASHWLTAQKVSYWSKLHKDKKAYRFGDGTLKVNVIFDVEGDASEEYAKWIAREYRASDFTMMMCRWWAEDWKQATVSVKRERIELNV